MPRRRRGAPSLPRRPALTSSLLGVAGFCPTVRRTHKLASRVNQALDKEVVSLTKSVDPDVRRRAVSYLYTKDTKSTFEIENERPSPQREELSLPPWRAPPSSTFRTRPP